MTLPPSPARYVAGSAAFAEWSAAVVSGVPPVRFPLGVGELGNLPFGPGRIFVLGGQPGAGKSALATQMVFDALHLRPDLRAVVMSVEMSAADLYDRQVARIADVDAETVGGRVYDPLTRAKVDAGMVRLSPLAGRIDFAKPPFSVANLGTIARERGACLLLVDYVQQLDPPKGVKDERQQINENMRQLRELATGGAAVLAVAAVARTGYGDGASLASFRGSSGLEFNADSAYVLYDAGQAIGPPGDDCRLMALANVKLRGGKSGVVTSLMFDKPKQRFTSSNLAIPDPATTKPKKGKKQ